MAAVSVKRSIGDENNNLCKTWDANRVYYGGFENSQAFPLEIAFATQALRFITFKQNMKRNFGGYSKVIR